MDGAVHQSHKTVYNRQPQTAAHMGGGKGGLFLLKGVEHLLHKRFTHANPCVLDRKISFGISAAFRLFPVGQSYRSLFGRKFDGIGNQVDETLLDADFIS